MKVVAADTQYGPQNECLVRRHRWCHMVLKALRPVTASLLEVLQGSTGGVWTRALRRIRPNEELLEVIEDGTAATQVVRSWANAGAQVTPTLLAPSMPQTGVPRALGHMNKAELQQEVLISRVLLQQLQEGIRLHIAARNRIAGVETLTQLRELCTERGII